MDQNIEIKQYKFIIYTSNLAKLTSDLSHDFKFAFHYILMNNGY